MCSTNDSLILTARRTRAAGASEVLAHPPEARRHAWAMVVSAAFLTSHLRSLSPLERTYYPPSHLSPANDWPQKG